MEGVTLSQLIFSVADELRLVDEKRKEDEKDNKKAVMAFSECELELKANIETDGHAGIKFHIISIGGGIKDGTSHSVKLKFKALPENVIIAAVENLNEGSRSPVKQ